MAICTHEWAFPIYKILHQFPPEIAEMIANEYLISECKRLFLATLYEHDAASRVVGFHNFYQYFDDDQRAQIVPAALVFMSSQILEIVFDLNRHFLSILSMVLRKNCDLPQKFFDFYNHLPIMTCESYRIAIAVLKASIFRKLKMERMLVKSSLSQKPGDREDRRYRFLSALVVYTHLF